MRDDTTTTFLFFFFFFLGLVLSLFVLLYMKGFDLYDTGVRAASLVQGVRKVESGPAHWRKAKAYTYSPRYFQASCSNPSCRSSFVVMIGWVSSTELKSKLSYIIVIKKRKKVLQVSVE